ncbi:hypothetical protein ACHAXT_006239 [Thalassiosira profunda]
MGSPYEEALDDVHTRFILNLPDEELQSATRIFFQLEQAWWFYDDFICDGAAARGEAPLPRFKHMRPFSMAMFKFSPLLQPMLPKFDAMYDEFSKYKRSISTYGTILLNRDATKIVLCRVYNGKSWTLPGGKVNQNETGKVAAARETYEETGFDPDSEMGLCDTWREMVGRGEAVEELQQEDELEGWEVNENALPWQPLQDADKLVYTEKAIDKRRTCYVCRGVPEAFPFEPVARKEVSEVGWHEIDSLPKKTYAVLPFMSQLKRWIKRDNRKRGIEARGSSRAGSRGKRAESRRGGSTAKPRRESQAKQRKEEEDFGLTPFFSEEGDAPWEEGAPVEVKETGDGGGASTPSKKERQRDKSSGKKGRSGSKGRNNSRAGSRGRNVSASDPLVESALASPGESDRWTEDQMFATNEVLLGRKFEYDGNPHDFAEKGFDVAGGGVDPHAFRVVGGAFLNSGEGGLSAPPEASKLQPLMARRRSLSGDGKSDGAGGDDEELTPFFSEEGKAPWEEPVAAGGIQRAPEPAGQSNAKGLALLNQLRQGTPTTDGGGVSATNASGKKEKAKKASAGASADDIFMTDKEITAKSQQEKLSILPPQSLPAWVSQEPPPAKDDEHMVWMKQWARQLPQTEPTNAFGDFRLDVDAVMNAMAAATNS